MGTHGEIRKLLLHFENKLLYLKLCAICNNRAMLIHRSIDGDMPYLLYVFGQTGLSKPCRPNETPQNVAFHQGLHCFATHPTIFRHNSSSKLYLFKFWNKYGKELWCPNTRVNMVSDKTMHMHTTEI